MFTLELFDFCVFASHQTGFHFFNKATKRFGSMINTHLVSGRSRVQISAQRLAILIEVLRGFSQSIQENALIVP
jgi:hypothetical protein